MQGDPASPDPKGGPISIELYREIRDWCTRLGCTEIELAEAIALVGYSPDLVRRFLAEAALKPSTPRQPPASKMRP